MNTEGRWRSAINYTNPLGSRGKMTNAFAKLLHEMWGAEFPYVTPIEFRVRFSDPVIILYLFFPTRDRCAP